jgi:putative ABC transport system permease protein
MAVPIIYNLRSLMVRKTTTIMTALGLALTVAVLVASLALVEGLRAVFQNTANPLQAVVLRKGGRSELGSVVSPEAFRILRENAAIAKDQNGEAMASLEMVQVVSLASVDNPKGTNVTVRGLSEIGIEMRNVQIAEGRWFRPGQREIVVGKSVARRYPLARVGQKLRFARGDWEIVGVIDGRQSAIDSEIWGDLNQISSDYNRQENPSSILLRATDPMGLSALVNSTNDDRRLNAVAIPEPEYYASQTSAGAPLEFLGIFVAVIMAVGSGFAAMNTMYAAVAKRTREIGMLRTLGFSQGSIRLSFLLESLLLSFFAGVLGCVIALPLNLVSTGVGSFVTFSEITFNFHVGVEPILAGQMFALLLGALGGFFPARSAARLEILAALRAH